MAKSLFSLQSPQTSEGEKFPGLRGRKLFIAQRQAEQGRVSTPSLECSFAWEILSMSGDPSVSLHTLWWSRLGGWSEVDQWHCSFTSKDFTIL